VEPLLSFDVRKAVRALHPGPEKWPGLSLYYQLVRLCRFAEQIALPRPSPPALAPSPLAPYALNLQPTKPTKPNRTNGTECLALEGVLTNLTAFAKKRIELCQAKAIPTRAVGVAFLLRGRPCGW
jgi:hypothetical protein